MKKDILLIEESQTVQKVVALSIDKRHYEVTYCKNRNEAHQSIQSRVPHLILLGDQVGDIDVATFVKEVEGLVGAEQKAPATVLIAGENAGEASNFSSLLRKPFTPSQLQSVIEKFAPSHVEAEESSLIQPPQPAQEGQNLENLFNQTFSDEASLMEETLMPKDTNPGFVSGQQTPQASTQPGGLWGPGPAANAPQVNVTAPPVAQQPVQPSVQAPPPTAPQAPSLESVIQNQVGASELEQAVDQMLAKIVPPIVERLVKERLDELLKESHEVS